MAAIANAVQGLNETIGLLKQILGAVNKNDSKKGGDKDGVQMKDLSSTAVILSKVDKKGSENIKNVLSAIEPLDKMSNTIGDKAKKIADAIKTLSTKEIVDGLKQYENISPKVVGNVFLVIKEIFMGIDGLSKNVDSKRIKEFANAMSLLSSTIKKTVSTLYMIAGFVLVAALVGVIAIFAWKYILTGFATIAATVLLIVGLTFLLKIASTIEEDAIKSILSMVIALYAVAGLVFVSALVGLLAIVAWKQILIGFATIVGIVMGILAVFTIIKMVNSLIKLMQFKLSGKNLGVFKHLIGGDMELPKDVGDILKVLLAIALLPIVSLLVGVIAMSYFGTIMAGFGAIAIILTGILFIINLAGNIGKGSKGAMNKIIGISILIATIAIVILMLVGITILMRENGVEWYDMIASITMMGLLMVGAGILLKVVGALKPSAKAIIAVVLVVAVMAVLTLLMHSIVDLTNKVEEAGGWGKVFITLAAISGFVLGVTLLIIGIGALMLIPYVFPILAIGAAVIASVSTVVILLAVAIKLIVSAYKDCESIGVDNLPSIGKSMGEALSGFVTKVVDGLKNISLSAMAKITIMMLPIQLIVNTTSKFIKMLSSFSTEDCKEGELKPVYYNEKTGEYVVGSKIDLANAASAISSSFAKFITTLADNLKNFTEDGADRIEEISEMNLLPIIESCSSFVKMVSSIVGSSDANKLFYYMTDKDGNYIKDSKGNYITREVDLVSAATTIANGFGVFVETLATKLNEIDLDGLEDITEVNLTSIMDSTTKFIQMVSDMTPGTEEEAKNGIVNIYRKDKNGNYIYEGKEIAKKTVNLKRAGEAIGNGISGFLLALTNGVTNISELDKFANDFGKITNSFEKITNTIFKIDDSKAQKIKEYTDAINKFAEAVDKVSESIDTLNGKEIDLKLDEISDKFNLIIGVDTSINVNNNSSNSASSNSNSSSSGGWFGKKQNNAPSINTESISNAILDGFKKINMIKVELNQNGGSSINLDGTLNIG